MKVLILASNYPRKNALNNGIFIHRQVKALQELGVECHVILLHNWYPSFGLHRHHTYWRDGHTMYNNFFEEYEGVKIHRVPMHVRMPSSLFNDNYYDRAARSIIKYVKKNKAVQNADWLYAHFLTDNGYIAAKIKDTLNVKLAAIARGDDVHAWPENYASLRPYLHLVFEKADLVLANSSNLGKDTTRWMLPGKTKEVHTVYNGIDYLRYRPVESNEERLVIRAKYNLSADEKYMVCIAPSIVLKGWTELLSAIKTLAGNLTGWTLLMVAAPVNNAETIDLEQTGKELGIEKFIVRIPGLPPNDLAELLRACDLFVLPSYNEGMANVLLEAMASGLASITTNVGGHSEVIRSGEDGVLINPRSVPELEEAIRSLTGNAELRKTMGVNARVRMINFGDYLHNSRRLLELFKRH